ncbi:hypothetical protein [Actinomadura oligospora]|uniref:hypothetical protein n=1 Tax=Actinomadura oligospora TaxID=111804 RepID=UPI00047E0756|nr:hypothetical protein [Actinomadura oligospora]
MDGVTAIVGGGAAVAASFLALTVAWTRPRLRPDAGRPLPVQVARLLDASWLTWAAPPFVRVQRIAERERPGMAAAIACRGHTGGRVSRGTAR